MASPDMLSNRTKKVKVFTEAKLGEKWQYPDQDSDLIPQEINYDSAETRLLIG